MKNSQSIFIQFVLLLIILLTLSIYFNEDQGISYTENCIQDFDVLISDINNVDTSNWEYETINPVVPWEIDTDIPLSDNDYYVLYNSIHGIRNIGDKSELWVYQRLHSNGFPINQKSVYLIYNLQKKEWFSLDAVIQNTKGSINDLVFTDDGNVWSSISFAGNNFNTENAELPLLSKFDEEKKKFFIISEIDIPDISINDNSLFYSYVVADKNNHIWIFINNVGIFTYDIESEATIKIADTKNLFFYDIAINPNDEIFFLAFDNEIENQDMLYQLSSDGKIYAPVKLPEEKDKYVTSIYFDPAGHLWLGLVGFLKADNKWIYLNPEIMENGKDTGTDWRYPTVIYGSSNGFIWSKRLSDNFYIDGTGWFDPKTNTGCKFTNLVIDGIYEDQEDVLWLATSNYLYKFEE